MNMKTFTADMARKNCDRHEALLEKRRYNYLRKLQKDIEIASSKGKYIIPTLGTKDEEFITSLSMALAAIYGLHLDGNREESHKHISVIPSVRYDPEEFAESRELDAFIKEFNRRT